MHKLRHNLFNTFNQYVEIFRFDEMISDVNKSDMFKSIIVSGLS